MSRLQLEDGRNKGWFWSKNSIFTTVDDEGEPLSGYAKSVYLVLCRHADNDERTCFLKIKTIEMESGWSHGTVVGALRDLIDAGLVNRTSRKIPGKRAQAPSVYQVLDPPAEVSRTVTNVKGLGRVVTEGQPQDDRGVGHEMARELDSAELDSIKKTKASAPSAGVSEVAASFSVKAASENPSNRPGRPALVVASDRNDSGQLAAPTHPRLTKGHSAIVRWYDRWKDHYAQAPTLTPKRKGILTQIYKRLEDDPAVEASVEYERLLDNLFQSQDSFILLNAHSPEVFVQRLDALRVGSGARSGRRGPIMPSQETTEVRECRL
jgi:hypothetical protein